MTSMSDKLSASVRKAKAQTAEDTKPEEVIKPARKASAKRPGSPNRARQGELSPKPAVKKETPKASQDELFPARVWPD